MKDEGGKLAGKGKDKEGTSAAAEEEDVALILHTSGTTGRPKAVRYLRRGHVCHRGVFG